MSSHMGSSTGFHREQNDIVKVREKEATNRKYFTQQSHLECKIKTFPSIQKLGDASPVSLPDKKC